MDSKRSDEEHNIINLIFKIDDLSRNIIMILHNNIINLLTG